MVTELGPEVGGWGGSCTCPDGQIYQVGHKLSSTCKILSCEGGVSGTCHKNRGEWSWRKVVCGQKVTNEGWFSTFSEKIFSDQTKVAGEISAGIGAGTVISGAATLGAKVAASAAIPTVASYTGTVVAGVGTMQSVTTASLMSFAATPVGAPVQIGGAVVGGISIAAWNWWDSKMSKSKPRMLVRLVQGNVNVKKRKTKEN